jgi:tetratricopeptide (TPR) repeat protein
LLKYPDTSRTSKSDQEQHFCQSSDKAQSEMSTPEALQAKSDGATAWSAGNFLLAVEHFTTAINLGGDKEFLKVLHSNRSAAYLKLTRITEALKDGNKCVELDSNWVKGYARKGDALLASKQFTEAYNAYNAGSRLAPNDNTMKEKMEQAMRAMRNAAEPPRSTSGSSSPFGNVNVPPTPEAGRYVQIAQVSILVLTLLYMIPLFPGNYRTIAHK